MPTPKSTDDIPMVQGLGTSTGGVSALTYIEARLKDLREAMGIEVQGLREMQLRFREDATRAREDMQEDFEKQLAERDLRYAQRFEASQQALSAAMIAAEKAINAALASAAQAVSKAETANERRFESVNEFRKTLSDQTASFMPRAEADAKYLALSEKLDALSSRMDKREGAGTGLTSGWGILVSVIGITGTIIGAIVLLTK